MTTAKRELPMVDGRRVKIVGDTPCYIYKNRPEHRPYLWDDGEWHSDLNGRGWWPTREAAEQFILSLAESQKPLRGGNGMSEPGTVYWLLRYDDPDHDDEVFTDEEAAQKAYDRAGIAWTCTLFRQVVTEQKPPASHTAELRKLVEDR